MKNVLISGAGIAGPALAYWLSRQGFTCTVVERAPALRTGGQSVDFRGHVHRRMLERMNLWEAVHEQRTTPGELVLLDRQGAPCAALPAVFTAGDVEILRGDLSRLLHDRTRDAVDYRFGDAVASIADGPGGVEVTFASGKRGTYDLVAGADGLHSGVRAAAFGDEARFLRHHGYRIATFAMDDTLGVRAGSVVYSVPGRAISVSATGRSPAGRALLVYRGGPFGPERRDVEAQKKALRAELAGMGWHAPRVLEALDQATDLYVDSITSVHMPSYAKGRVVLLGDAAYGGTLGGQGTPLAMIGAYVLAGEVDRGDGIGPALARYEARMRPYAERCQKGAMNAGMFFAPATGAGLAMRNAFYRLLASPALRGFLEWLVKDAASDFVLPEYA